jgi:hypothetical protein
LEDFVEQNFFVGGEPKRAGGGGEGREEGRGEGTKPHGGDVPYSNGGSADVPYSNGRGADVPYSNGGDNVRVLLVQGFRAAACMGQVGAGGGGCWWREIVRTAVLEIDGGGSREEQWRG